MTRFYQDYGKKQENRPRKKSSHRSQEKKQPVAKKGKKSSMYLNATKFLPSDIVSTLFQLHYPVNGATMHQQPGHRN